MASVISFQITYKNQQKITLLKMALILGSVYLFDDFSWLENCVSFIKIRGVIYDTEVKCALATKNTFC